MISYEPLAEEAIKNTVKRVKKDGRARFKLDCDLAVDYLENRQVDDVQQELLNRFPSSQMGDAGQQMYPVTIPTTERYIAEAATAYNRAVAYTVVNAEGKEDATSEGLTKQYNYGLEESKYVETMHRADQLVCLLRTCGLWHQSKRKKLRPVIALPQDIYPVCPADGAFMDSSDPDDYDGYVVEYNWAKEDADKAVARSFAIVTPATTAFYTGADPWDLDKIIGVYQNPYKWEQTVQNGEAVSTGILPGRMLTFWHSKLPLGELLIESDPDIAFANRELNVAWSVLFDTMRFQGYATPVKKVINPADPKAKQRHGARFPVVIDIAESFEYAVANVSYSEQVKLLETFAKTMAAAKRQSPNDFSMEQQAAMSGFAKVVDSMPKLEAREERLKRLSYMEQVEAWPRNRAIMIQNGKLDATALNYKLRVKFSDVSFPLSMDEETKKLESDIKYNLTTPAQVLAKRIGISEADAEEVIKKNAESNKELKQGLMEAAQAAMGQQGQGKPGEEKKPGFGGGRLGGSIGKKAGVKKEEPPKEEAAK